ncbi:hypothetical protein U1Q18_021919 [Sarracenia purpurea var. burkii]
MSTDLEFRQGLPQLRLSTDRSIATSQLAETIASGDDGREKTPIWTPKSGSESSGDDECQTPTSAEHKIPATLSCPPAPKKPRQLSGSCKRKMCEIKFFEIVEREEIESFFRSSSGLNDVNSTGVVKRRCPCT